MTDDTVATEKPLQYTTRQLLRDMWRYIRPYRAKFIFATFIRIISDVSALYFAFALAFLVTFFTQYTFGTSLVPAWTTLALFLASSLIHHAGRFIARLNGFAVAEKVALDVHVQAMEHMASLDISWHEKSNAGNKLKRIQKGTHGIDQLIRIWFVNAIQIVVDFAGIIFIIGSVDYLISAIMIVFIVTFTILSKHLSTKSAEASHVVNIKEEDVFGLSFEVINNIRTVKIMSMMRGLFKELRREIDILFGKTKKRIFRYQSRNFIMAYWVQVFRFGLFALIIYGITQGQYEVGFLILFNGYFDRIRVSLDELSEVTQEFDVAKYGVGRMMQVLAEPINIDSEKDKVEFPKTWEKISFKNVSFGYGNKEVLSNISFDIKKGERIGIVGLSGAGKSTLFKLLLKEHENFSGSITVDDLPVQSIGKQDYFEHVAVVLQETEVFNFPLRDNIILANQKHAEDKALLDRALEIAHVTEFLPNLPQGVDTFIGEKGVKLSGGEKQRLGIARAIFKQPELLLLDEATSHLDLESEEKIQDSLHKFFQNVTAVVIAHRLTTIKEMDKILVLEDGRLIESGSFAELYEKKGRFFDLWEKQKL